MMRSGSCEKPTIWRRLLGLMDSFMECCENAREDFKLGPELDPGWAPGPENEAAETSLGVGRSGRS